MKRLAHAAATAFLPALFAFGTANAEPVQIRLSEGTSTATFSSADPTGAVAGTGYSGFEITGAGQVSFNGSFGTFSTNVTTGTGSGASSASQGIDLNSLNISTSSASPGVLTLSVTETNLTSVAPILAFLGQIGGTFSGGIASVTYAAYVDAANTAFGMGQLIASGTFGTSPYAGSGTTQATGLSTFSETEVITITSRGGTGTVSFDAQLMPVPEPATLALLGSGLLIFGLFLRARREEV